MAINIDKHSYLQHSVALRIIAPCCCAYTAPNCLYHPALIYLHLQLFLFLRGKITNPDWVHPGIQALSKIGHSIV